MFEKIKFVAIHPMRGHSYGEWYATLDDIVESEENAEYWAVFGVTCGGIKYCLGEFRTKQAALAAVQSSPIRH